MECHCNRPPLQSYEFPGCPVVRCGFCGGIRKKISYLDWVEKEKNKEEEE